MENGLNEAGIARLDADQAEFTRRENLALEFSEQMALRHKDIGDEFFAELRTEFSDAEVIELGMMIGQYIGFGRLLQVLDLEDKTCPI